MTKLDSKNPVAKTPGAMNRRRFLRTGAAAGAFAASLPTFPIGFSRKRRPNLLLIISDQMNLDALSAAGCRWARTPNLDRLSSRGVMFLESHSTNPVCSPARSSLFTGRMPVETGVISNTRAIHPKRPTMGAWFGREGYDAVYCGKWHLPGGYPDRIDGFRVLPARGGQGDLVDGVVSRMCADYLIDRDRTRPFLLAASFMNPHDICYWAIRSRELVPPKLPFPRLARELPGLPPNLRVRPPEPERLRQVQAPAFTDDQWRYYRYVYYRQVERVDAQIGRVLEALEASGQADNTLIVFTSDHGEGGGRHTHVQKWYPYDEAVKVPLVVSWPGHVAAGVRDSNHLVSGLDIMSTFCDYAGVKPPSGVLGRSLRPLLEQKNLEWREFVAAEMQFVGRMIRTPRYKYVRYRGDPIEQLFDMKADPWEMHNLYQDPASADVMAAHRKLLDAWEKRMDTVKPMPVAHG